ncbi:MAG: DUF2189 domain-containing protein [Boseongicola sp.]
MEAFHVFSSGSADAEEIKVRQIEVSDVVDALKQGYADFVDRPSHYLFLVIIFPVIGVLLFSIVSGGNAFQLLFPLMSGFALIGPIAAIGLYEISRRREKNMDTSWKHAFDVRKSPAVPAIVAVGAFLVVLFLMWLLAAHLLFLWLYGDDQQSITFELLYDMISTPRGWTLILLGNGIGFCFAAVVLCTTVVAFPLLLDRDVGAIPAVKTSLRSAAINPVPMMCWGIIVAGVLFLGALPGLAGLIVALPVLGHATWHIYRKVVEPAGKTAA